MSQAWFNNRDCQQIVARGLRVDQLLAQIRHFQKGVSWIRLDRPASPGDGLTVIPETDFERLIGVYGKAVEAGRACKFVPASGVGSRMFKALLAAGPDSEVVADFVRSLRQFAFYDDLREALARADLDLERLAAAGRYRDILDYLLAPQGLNYAHLPKGLFKFHRYPDHCRCAFEEHLVEAQAYVQDRHKVARVHFTVMAAHQPMIQAYLETVKERYEQGGRRLEISFSTQKPVTDTLAVDPGNRPFRDPDGRLVFWPAGHGALLENLNDLKGDIIFIKNIDNVVPDRLKTESNRYKRILGGYLVELQHTLFDYLYRLADNDICDQTLERMSAFFQQRLSGQPPEGFQAWSRAEKRRFLFNRFNRPLRVCGVVKNTGEPGGGPFWVASPDGTVTLQIVEAAEVDPAAVEQQEIFARAGYFNPVDVVCGVRNYRGEPFNLLQFRDPERVFISTKSRAGRSLKVMELPGLWNGAMAYWNTVFVEVPLTTFNPVKTVQDLLGQTHQFLKGG